MGVIVDAQRTLFLLSSSSVSPAKVGRPYIPTVIPCQTASGNKSVICASMGLYNTLAQLVKLCYYYLAVTNTLTQKRKEIKTMSAKVKESNLTSKRDIMKITTRDDAIPMKDVPSGTEIKMVAYVIEDVTKDYGDTPTFETFECILIADGENKVYATRSATFIEKIRSIMEELGNEDTEADPEPLLIRITQQKSRSGNNFVSCCLA